MEEIRRTDGHILRRNTRLSLDFNSPYDPNHATPEENSFEVRKGNGAMVGPISFQKFGHNRAAADTPWGRMEVAKSSLLGPFEVTLGGTPIARYSLNMSRTRMNVTFTQGGEMSFEAKLLTKALSCATGSGRVEVLWEGEYGPADIRQDGLIRRDMPKELSDKIDETRADYKRRKKAKLLDPGEPKTILMPYYVQWRVLFPKEYDGRDDLLSSLMFITSFRFLQAEVPPSG